MTWSGASTGEHFLASNPASALAASTSVPASGTTLTGGSLIASLWDNGGQVFHLAAGGTKTDGKEVIDANMGNGSAILTSVSNRFLPTDVGKGIIVTLSPTVILSTTILSYQSAGQITLNATASQAGVNVGAVWFTDNGTTVLATIASLPSLGTQQAAKVGAIFCPPGITGSRSQLAVPIGTSVKLMGAGRAASMLYYGGGTLQSFVKFLGGNTGSELESLCITGPYCDSAVDIQTNIPSGTYNSLINFIDCYIGFCLVSGTALPTAAYMAYSGANIQCDVFGAWGTAFYGRNFGVRFRVGTTDAYLGPACVFSSNPQGGEPRGIGLLCEDADAPTLFNGTIHITECNAALGSEAAVLLRSVAHISGLYIESTVGIPLKVVACALRMYGGKIATNLIGGAGQTALIAASGGSHGQIIGTYLGAPTGANNLTSLISTTGSPYANCWTIILPHKSHVSGTLPANLLSIDAPAVIIFPGNTGGGTGEQILIPTFDTATAINLSIGVTNASQVYLSRAGGFLTIQSAFTMNKDFRRSRQTPTETVLVSGVDATAGELVEVTLTAARVVGAPLNPAIGQRLTFTLIQGGAGAFAVTWNAVFKKTWADTGNATGARSSIEFAYNGTNWNQVSAQSPYV